MLLKNIIENTIVVFTITGFVRIFMDIVKAEFPATVIKVQTWVFLMVSPSENTVKIVGLGLFSYNLPCSLKIRQVSGSYLGSQHPYFGCISWSALDLEESGVTAEGGEEMPQQRGSQPASWAGRCSQPPPTKPVPFQLISASQQLCVCSSRSCLWVKRALERAWLQRLFSKHLSTQHTHSSVNSQLFTKSV